MRCFQLLFILFLFGLITGCSGDNSVKEAYIEGRITVADSIDASENYADIGINLIDRDSLTSEPDTIFSALTGKDGNFHGKVEFKERRQYLMIVSRNGQNVGRTGVILADQDTIRISAQLPGFLKTLNIKSHEHKALQSFQRVEQSFQRVGLFARSGRLKGDSLTAELKKWPGIYWDVYQKYPKTIAGSLAAKKTVELLDQWDQPAMMEKLETLKGQDKMVYLAATYGTAYKAKNASLDSALIYLEELEKKTEEKEAHMRIQMERIDLLYDSARVEKAQNILNSFKDEFESEVAKKWAQSVEYDLNFLSPGDAIPPFKFTDDGQEITRENLKGKPYLLEITSLSNPIYQQQYDRTVIIHSLYKNYDFDIVTIPMDTSDVTVEAFFEERVRPWPVAPANTFNMEELIDRFNVKNLPTRFLIDREGRIVRRYVGDEYEEVIQGIQQIINK